MAKEVVKEFETVEKERTIEYCDRCGNVEDNLIDIAINPKIAIGREWNIVETFEDLTEAELEMQNINETKEAGKVNRYPTPRHAEMSHKYGIAKRPKVKSTISSASVEFCPKCVIKFFDIEIPEEEIIDDIEMETGGISIKTTKEVRSIWPQFLPEWLEGESINDSVLLGWKGKVVFWPVIPFFIFLDGVMDNSDEWRERKKGYFAASLGAILWTTITYLALTMFFGVTIIL